MFKNYIKITIRNIQKHKAYSLINILGLTIGITSTIFIMLWVQDELSFDQFHAQSDQIYRVITEQHQVDQITHSAETQFPLAIGLKEEFPEITKACRLFTKWKGLYLKYGDNSFEEDGVFFADPSFLEMFTFPFTSGSYKNALVDPHSIVLTEEMATKYFGKNDAVGETIYIDYGGKLTGFLVTGILINIPHNSHLQFDFLIPFHIFDEIYANTENLWKTVDNYQTYVMLDENVECQPVNEKISGYKTKHLPESKDRLLLQPMTSIHLHSNVKFDSPNNSSIEYIYLFSVIALFILLIASINFMNLSTARSTTRSREVGLRKVFGAHRTQIIRQFFSESLFQAFIALACSFLLVSLFLPSFNYLSGKNISLNLTHNMNLYLFLIGITLFTGLISGTYPALFFSSFQPASILKGILGKFNINLKGKTIRHVLLLIQFALSIILLISTIIISGQLHFMKNKDLGYNHQDLIYLPVRGDLRNKYQSLKNELLKHSAIKGVSASNHLPTHGNESLLDNWDGNNGTEKLVVNVFSVDYDYLETLDIKVTNGRSFSKTFAGDLSNSVIVNEEAVKQMGMKSPLGKKIWGNEIVGVVNNYHFKSLHKNVEPLLLFLTDRHYAHIFIRTQFSPQIIEHIQEVYEKFVVDFPFEYQFLNKDIEQFYINEERSYRLYMYFTGIALFIAFIGLLSLTSFLTEQRTKEIGIRKVLGSSIFEIIILFSKDFIKWILLANIFAWPIAWYAMNQWLHNFAYRIDIGLWTFLYAGVIALVIALLTVSYQAIRAAIANPVESLRYE